MNILTQELLKPDLPLFEFVIRDAPYPMNNWYWPQPLEVAPFCFLAFGEFLMDEVSYLFKIKGHFDRYDLTNFQTKAELSGLIDNIEREIAEIQSHNQEKFLARFGSSLKSLTGMVSPEELAEHWEILRSDLIEILSLICQQAQIALRDGKTVAIIGI